MFFRPCSICTAPEAVRNLIHAELVKKTPLNKIQALCEQAGHKIHRSSLSRHSRKCLNRTRENQFSGYRVPMSQCRQFIHWDKSCPPEMQNSIPAHVYGDGWVVIEVSYEAPSDYHGNALDIDGRYSNPDQAYKLALAENAVAFPTDDLPDADPDTES